MRPGSKRCETVAASATAPPGSGRYGRIAAWKWPWILGGDAPASGRTNGDTPCPPPGPPPRRLGPCSWRARALASARASRVLRGG